MKIVFVIFCFFLFQSCISIDTITRTQSLKDGDVILSVGKRFAFGFFSLGDSKLRYVGIWYAQVSQQTIVWIANRDNPINDTSGVIKFSNSGNLCVYASDNETELVWSTNVWDSILDETTLVARLSDLGNLVLLDSVTGKSFWESFDYPTDTFLPFMRLGFTRKDGLDRFLTSWRSPSDPGSGDITLKMVRRAFPQLILYKGSIPWWRMGSWTGHRWSGVPDMPIGYIFNNSFVSNEDEVTFTYGLMDGSVITRTTVNETGTMHRFTWIPTGKRWNDFWSVPKEQCDSYAHCGPNGYCDPTSSKTFECTCLPGYEPKIPRHWFLRDSSGGCKKKNRSSICRENDGFVKLKRVKVPETSDVSVDMNITLKECKQRCLRKCTCVAYASAYHESKRGAIGCLTWHGDMLDVRTYLNFGQDFYIRVDKEELARWNSDGLSGKTRLVLILISLCAVVLLIVMLFCVIKARRNSNRHRSSSTNFTPVPFDFEESFSFEQDKARNRELPFFDLNTIAAATNNFSSDNKLGAGGFGPVYKGLLQNGMEIAVKRLSRNSGQGMEEFKNEVKLISKLQHRNLVKILGCCVELEEKMLIYEYLPNKSLDCFIFHGEKRSQLDWPKRMEIICGIARGILYLHQDSRLRIIHRDLKASNILLDSEMIPKISDFGMARIFGGNQIEGCTSRVVGTFGYMSPEYAMEGHFSVKSDVYSFGVLMLEIITGKKNNAFHEESSNLIGHVWDLWENGEARDIIDKLMDKETYDESEVMKCIHIGLLCVQEKASDRVDMSSVVIMLGHKAIDLPYPKHPAFTSTRRIRGENGTWQKDPTGISVKDVTFTSIHGR